MFLICRKDTHVETGDSSFSWYGKIWNEPISSKSEALEIAKARTRHCIENEKAKNPESVKVVSETEFIYNYFGATRVEFSVVEVKPC